LQESHDFFAEFAKNIEERDIIYWVQGLCPNREKSLALGKRGLEVPRWYIVIFGMYAFGMVYIACPPRLKRPKGWLKLLVSSPNLLTKKSQIHLSELRWEIDQEDTDSEDQESGIVGTHNRLRK
jgi:hypothetical protein